MGQPTAPDIAAALLAAMALEADEDLAYAAEPTVLAGGFHAHMLRFRLADPPEHLAGDLVARILPWAPTGLWETVLQGGAAAQGFPTPRIRLATATEAPIASYLIVMDFVDGRTPLSGLRAADLPRQVPAAMRQLPDELARMAERLHRLDHDAIGRQLTLLAAGHGGPAGDHGGRDTIPDTTTGFVEWQGLMAAGHGRHDLVAASERLAAHPPADQTTAVVHGDLHPFNLLVPESGPTVLIDWTMGRVGHPAYTLAFTQLMLGNPPLAVPRPARVALDLLGRHLAKRFMATYRSLTADRPGDVDAEALRWHRQVHCLRIAVELANFDAAGPRPAGHPWTVLEPVVLSELGLDPPAPRA